MKLILNTHISRVPCEIIIAPSALNELKNFAGEYSKVFVIADKNAYEFHKDQLTANLPEKCDLIEVEITEKDKNLTTVGALQNQLRQLGCDRKSLVISFGGGIVSDVVGFVASSYMRGVDWIAVPSTLIAQADAAIGGKTGVNLDDYKNLVGAFWQPKAVLIDTKILQTLPMRHFNSGLAEIIKKGIIYDKNIVGLIDDNVDLNDGPLNDLIALSVKSKVEIVNKDNHESGERKLLNFGHTIGHAIESMSLQTADPLLHGEAVAIGMVAESKLAELEGLCDAGLAESVVAMLNRFSLPSQVSGAKPKEIAKIILFDKKNQDNIVLWTLPINIGQGKYNHEATPENIKKAIEFIC